MDVIMWILVIAAAVTILWYVFGNSPTFEQSLIVFIFGLFFTFGKEYYSFKQSTILSFSKARSDMASIKKDLTSIKNDVTEIKKILKRR